MPEAPIPNGLERSEELALRLLQGEALDRYLEFRKELRDALDEVRELFRKALGDLGLRQAKPEAYAELDQERDELLAYHRKRFIDRVSRMLDDVRPDDESGETSGIADSGS